MLDVLTPIESFLPLVAFFVQTCPSNNSEWMKASEKLNCSSIDNKFLYHCVPNQNLSRFIEFCYDVKRIGVQKGHCLKLDDSGTLYPVNCENFRDGCPNKFYFSNKVWQYPKCLQINTYIGCFRAEQSCQESSSSSLVTSTTTTGSYNGRIYSSSPNITSSIQPEITRIYPSSPNITSSIQPEIARNRSGDEGWKIATISLTVLLVLLISIFVIKRISKKGRLARCGRKFKCQNETDLEEEKKLFLDGENSNEERNEEAFLRAARDGETTKMENLLKSAEALEKDFENEKPLVKLVNARDEDRNCKTALHFASEEGYSEAIKLLIKFQANVNLTDSDGKTAIYNASESNFRDIVEILINCTSVLVDIPDKFGRTAIYQAISKDNTSIINLLYNHGANINYHGLNEITPLMLAIHNRRFETVKMFIEGPLNNREDKGRSNLFHAVDALQEKTKDDLEPVRLLLKSNADVNICDFQNQSPLLLACKKRRIDAVELLLENDKCNIVNQGELNFGIAPLHQAVQLNDILTVEVLLTHRGDPNVKDKNHRTPLHFAVEEGNLILFKKLLGNGADINCVDNENASVLHYACQEDSVSDDLELVQYLLSEKDSGRFEFKDSDTCKSPIFYAIRKNASQKVHLLHTNGFTLSPLEGKRVIHLTAHKRNLNNLKYLIEQAGVNINEEDKQGRTPLYIVASGADVNIIEYLIKKGADVNKCNENGRSPLHEAVSEGNLQVVKELIEHGADLYKKDNSETTPLDEAMNDDYQYKDVTNYLKSLSCSSINKNN